MELEAEVGRAAGPVWGQIPPALAAWIGKTQVTSGLAAGPSRRNRGSRDGRSGAGRASTWRRRQRKQAAGQCRCPEII